MAGEWNAQTREDVYKTNRPPSDIFSVDYNDLKFSEMFHSTLGLKIDMSVRVFLN